MTPLLFQPGPMMGAIRFPCVVTGMPMEPYATGAVFASNARTAAYRGSKPRLAIIAAVIATGAPKPAMPSIRAPNAKATISACTRRSSVRPARECRKVSNAPASIVMLCKKMAFSTIQEMGQRPKARPNVVAPTVGLAGIPQMT